jgi:hypothetical protein
MLDRDLAELYGVSTKVLNQAVKRHKDRFPEDFMFQLTMQEGKQWWVGVEADRLRSQLVTLKVFKSTSFHPHPSPPPSKGEGNRDGKDKLC